MGARARLGKQGCLYLNDIPQQHFKLQALFQDFAIRRTSSSLETMAWRPRPQSRPPDGQAPMASAPRPSVMKDIAGLHKVPNDWFAPVSLFHNLYCYLVGAKRVRFGIFGTAPTSPSRLTEQFQSKPFQSVLPCH